MKEKKLRREKKQKPNDFSPIILVVAALVIGFFAYRHFAKTTPPTPVAESGPPQAENAIETVDYSVEAPKSTASIQAEKRQYVAILKTGLKEVPSRTSGKDTTIKVRVSALVADCSIGDFDFLKGAINNIIEDSFLLSIEAIGKSSTKHTKRLSMKDMTDGSIFEIKLPKADKAKDYGVALCFDFKKSGDCLSKPLLAAKEWKTLLNNIKENDRVFYYQMLSLRDGKAYLMPSHQWDEKSFQTMKSSLKGLVEDPASLDKLKNNTRKLRPLPARISKDVLDLPLPSRNPSC